MIQDKLPTTDNLLRRSMHLPNICSNCMDSDENTEHLFNRCVYFSRTLLELQHILKLQDDTRVIVETDISREARHILSFLHYAIWKERCNRVFRDVRLNEKMLAQFIADDWYSYKRNRKATLLV